MQDSPALGLLVPELATLAEAAVARLRFLEREVVASRASESQSLAQQAEEELLGLRHPIGPVDLRAGDTVAVVLLEVASCSRPAAHPSLLVHLFLPFHDLHDLCSRLVLL